ncbi:MULTISPECIES: hypothetical protein [Bacillus amyloliquefaciens group]|nr:hypothetical protein [Bacillus velezensis]WKD96547.1 hypothetical protein QY487_19105 [Bacillus velezensis]
MLKSKLNSWYTSIKKNMIEEAQKKKLEVESLLEEVDMLTRKLWRGVLLS